MGLVGGAPGMLRERGLGFGLVEREKWVRRGGKMVVVKCNGVVCLGIGY